MRKVFAIVAFLLLMTAASFAQFTSVSGTITDPAGVPYANGFVNADFKNGTGCGQALLGGTSPFQLSARAGLDSTGSFSALRLAGNDQVGCATSRWTFTTCNATATTCFSVDVNVTGATLNVGATLSASSLALVGLNNRIMTVLQPQTAITTVSTIQALNSSTITIPAGTLNVIGKTLRFCGQFVFSNGVTTPTLTVTLKYGSVTLAAPVSSANANSNSSSPAFFCFTTTTATTGATGTVEAHGYLQENVASAVAGAAMATFPDTVTAASSAIDLTSAITVTVNLTVSGGPVTTATLRQGTIELLN